MIDDSTIERLCRDYPFMTYFEYGEQGILGIVQNVGPEFVMVFDIDRIMGNDLKKKFIELGQEWWYESNAELPIDSFLGRRFDQFRHCLKGYNAKEIRNMTGPRVSIHENFIKRTKKRRIEIVRKEAEGNKVR